VRGGFEVHQCEDETLPEMNSCSNLAKFEVHQCEDETKLLGNVSEK
jgi:hypothetical protein